MYSNPTTIALLRFHLIVSVPPLSHAMLGCCLSCAALANVRRQLVGHMSHHDKTRATVHFLPFLPRHFYFAQYHSQWHRGRREVCGGLNGPEAAVRRRPSCREQRVRVCVLYFRMGMLPVFARVRARAPQCVSAEFYPCIVGLDARRVRSVQA